MPIIPNFTQKNGVISDSPQGVEIQPYYQGSEGSALSRVGDVVANASDQLIAKRKEAQDQDYAFNTAMKDARDLEAYKLQLKTQVSDNYDGYSAAIQKWSNDRFTENQKNAPSNTAKELYQRQAGNLFNGTVIESMAEENKQKAISYVGNMKSNVDTNGATIVSNPDPKMANFLHNMSQQQIDSATGVTISDSTASVLKNQVSATYAKSYLDGLYQKGLGDSDNGKAFFEQGISALNAGPSKNSFMSGLDPHEKAMYLDKFINARDQANKVNLTELNHRIEDSKTAVFNGDPVDSRVFSDLDLHTRSGDITPDARVRILDSYNNAKIAGQVIDRIKISSPDQWGQFASQFESMRKNEVQAQVNQDPSLVAAQETQFNATDRQSWKNKIAVQAQAEWKKRVDDPAAYVNENLPGMANLYAQTQGNGPQVPSKTQAYINQQLANQKQLGLPDSLQKIVSKDEAYTLGLSLNGTNATQISNNLSSLETKYGPYAGRVFNELVDAKKVDAGLWIAHNVQDPTEREKVVSTFLNSKDINKAYDTQYATDKDKKKDFESALSNTLDNQYSAYAQINRNGGSLEYANAIREAVSTQAKQMLVQNPNMKPEDAIKGASESFTRTFPTLSADNSAVVHPAVIAGQPANENILRAFMNSHKKPDALDTMNILPPGGMPKQDFYDQIEKNGSWVTRSGSFDGVKLVVRNPSTGYQTEVLDRDKRPIQYRYSDINNASDPFTLQQAKPALKKFFELFTGKGK